jgi:hypothetical protein
MALPKMAVRVAMRHTIRNRFVERDRNRKPHYVRLLVKVDLPSRDEYLQKILSTAARASDSLPFIRHAEPVEITLDIPTTLDRRKAVRDALNSLPYVRSVLVGMGPPIR